MMVIPEHTKNSKIGQDIRRERGNPVVILRDESLSLFDRIQKSIFSRVTVATLLVISVILYTGKAPFLKAETTVFYPKACLGGFDGVSLAEGEPETKIDSDASSFDIKNSAYLSKDRSAELYCGNFDGEVLDHTTPKNVVLTLFLHSKENTQTLIKNEINETGATFLEVLDAKGTPILEETGATSSTEESTQIAPESTLNSKAVTPDNATDVKADVSNKREENKTTAPESVETKANSTNGMSETIESNNTEEKPQSVLQKITPFALHFIKKAYAEERGEGEEPAVSTSPSISNEERKTEPAGETSVLTGIQKMEATSQEMSPDSGESLAPKSETVPQEAANPSPEIKKVDSVAEKEMANEDLSAPIGIKSFLEGSFFDQESSSILSSIKNVISQENISNNTSTSTENALYEVAYSLGGEEWKILATLGKDNTKTMSITLSDFSSWSEISKLQVRIKSLDTVDEKHDFYVDGMVVVIQYEKDIVTDREYTLSYIENTGKKLTVSSKGENGKASHIVMIASEEAGLAVYNLDTRALVMTTQVQSVNESFFDPNASIPEYGSYALVLNNDAGWCGVSSLKECLEGESFLGLSFLTIAPSKESKESERIKKLKEELVATVAPPIKVEEEVKEEFLMAKPKDGASNKIKDEGALEPPPETVEVKKEEVSGADTVKVEQSSGVENESKVQSE